MLCVKPSWKRFHQGYASSFHSVIDINGLITNDKFCLSRITHVSLGYCRLPEPMKRVLTVTSGYASTKDVSSRQGGPHETTPVEDHTPACRTSRCPAPVGSGVPVPDALEPGPTLLNNSQVRPT